VQIVDIEQGSYEWHCLRQGKVTGTTLKSALGTRKVQDTLMYKLIAERMTEPQIADINSAAVTRGTELEPMARKAVIAQTGIDFVETGMLISDDLPEFGFSPDGVFFENGKIVGGLEIKCPDSKKHIEYVIDNGLPKEYEAQVLAPFLMCDSVQWWIFASFDDRNYERPLFTKRIERGYFKNLQEQRQQLSDFLARVESSHAELTF
jgi:putative phage-type endonuclease